MFKYFSNTDFKTKAFLNCFLHIIFFTTVAMLFYGIASAKALTPLENYILCQNMILTFEYLFISLCECICGTLILDYVFKNPGKII